MLIPFIIAVVLLALAFAGIGIKMFVKKDGQFERHCENSPTGRCICGGDENKCLNKSKKAEKESTDEDKID